MAHGMKWDLHGEIVIVMNVLVVDAVLCKYHNITLSKMERRRIFSVSLHVYRQLSTVWLQVLHPQAFPQRLCVSVWLRGMCIQSAQEGRPNSAMSNLCWSGEVMQSLVWVDSRTEVFYFCCCCWGRDKHWQFCWKEAQLSEIENKNTSTN